MGNKSYTVFHKSVGGLAISNDNAFENCTAADSGFVAEADDMPYLSLAVDGLTNYSEARGGRLDMYAGDAAANDASSLAMEQSNVVTDTDHGAESDVTEASMNSTWGKVKNYFGF